MYFGLRMRFGFEDEINIGLIRLGQQLDTLKRIWRRKNYEKLTVLELINSMNRSTEDVRNKIILFDQMMISKIQKGFIGEFNPENKYDLTFGKSLLRGGLDMYDVYRRFKLSKPEKDDLDFHDTVGISGYADKPKHEFLWIFVRRTLSWDDKWWPQKRVKPDINNRWQTSITVGQNSDSGYTFQVSLMLVGKRTNCYLEKYKRHASKINRWDPIGQPRVIAIVYSRIVRRL